METIFARLYGCWYPKLLSMSFSFNPNSLLVVVKVRNFELEAVAFIKLREQLDFKSVATVSCFLYNPDEDSF